MNEKTARRLLFLLPLVVGIIGLVPYLLAWSSFPSRIASHFTSSGVPDGSMTPGNFLVVNGILFLVGAAMCGAVALIRRPLVEGIAMVLAVTGAFLAAVPAASLLVTAWEQRGLEDWRDAPAALVPTLVAVFGLGLLSAAAAGRLGVALPTSKPLIGADARPVMSLADGEQAVWHGQMRWIVGIWLAIFTTLMALVIGYATGQWLPMVVLLVCAVPILALSAISVRADRSGLRIRYGKLPWPQTFIATGDIESAAVIEVLPREWGGWGYRGSLTLMKQAAVVLRKGPGIRLELHNGKVFAVTVDDPETAVALLNAEIARLEPVAT